MGACVSAYVVRDVRQDYAPDDLVQPKNEVSLLHCVLPGDNGRDLHVSYYRQEAKRTRGVILFLHGSCGSSRDHSARAEYVVQRLQMDAVLVDFGGCGRSGGRVTWGIEEQEDFHRAIEYVKSMRPGEPIGVCAFSLGAAVAVMGAPKHPEIACMVLDSTFSRLPDAIKHWIRCRLPGPKALHKPLARWVCRSVQQHAGLDLQQVAPVDHVHLCKMPLLFLGVENDDVVPPESADELFNHHSGYSELLRLSGSHNGQRTQEVIERQLSFLEHHMLAATAAVAAPARPARKSAASAAAAAVSLTASAAAGAAAIRSCDPGRPSLELCFSGSSGGSCRQQRQQRLAGIKGIRVSLDQLQLQQQQQREPLQPRALLQEAQQPLQQQQQEQAGHAEEQDTAGHYQQLVSQSSLASSSSLPSSPLCTVTLILDQSGELKAGVLA